jgi:hypothetical protein
MKIEIKKNPIYTTIKNDVVTNQIPGHIPKRKKKEKKKTTK